MIVPLETLLAEDRLGEVAVLAGSEAASGLPKMGFKRPSFVSKSADELATVIDGSYLADRKTDVNLAYGQAKLIGAPPDRGPSRWAPASPRRRSSWHGSCRTRQALSGPREFDGQADLGCEVGERLQ